MKLLLSAIFQLIVIFVVHAQSASSKFRGIEIKIGDSWVNQESGLPPVNKDTVLFLETIVSKVEYPSQALRMGIEGDVVCTIELNELGEVVEYVIIKDIGAGTFESVANVLKNLPGKWTPAIVDDKSVKSRILVLFNFHLGVLDSYPQNDNYHLTFLVMATGTGGAKWKTVDARQIGNKTKTSKKKKSK